MYPRPLRRLSSLPRPRTVQYLQMTLGSMLLRTVAQGGQVASRLGDMRGGRRPSRQRRQRPACMTVASTSCESHPEKYRALGRGQARARCMACHDDGFHELEWDRGLGTETRLREKVVVRPNPGTCLLFAASNLQRRLQGRRSAHDCASFLIDALRIIFNTTPDQTRPDQARHGTSALPGGNKQTVLTLKGLPPAPCSRSTD